MPYTVAIVSAHPGVNLPHFHFLNVTWTDSTDPNSVSVNVYRSTVSGGPYTKIFSGIPMGTQLFKDTSALLGVQYFYVVTEVDNNNNESIFSVEQTGTIPG